MLDEVFTALNIGDNQWALELASHVVRSQPNNQRARALRLDSLRALAAAETNPIARNFYLTSLLDDQKPIDWAVYSVPMIDLIDVQSLLELMKVQLRAEAASGVNSTLFIHFEDTNRTFQLQVREYFIINGTYMIHNRNK